MTSTCQLVGTQGSKQATGIALSAPLDSSGIQVPTASSECKQPTQVLPCPLPPCYCQWHSVPAFQVRWSRTRNVYNAWRARIRWTPGRVRAGRALIKASCAWVARKLSWQGAPGGAPIHLLSSMIVSPKKLVRKFILHSYRIEVAFSLRVGYNTLGNSAASAAEEWIRTRSMRGLLETCVNFAPLFTLSY